VTEGGTKAVTIGEGRLIRKEGNYEVGIANYGYEQVK
jgi:hypothetical protein